MAYVTWAEVANAVEGEKRLINVVLAGRGDTAGAHPYFDSLVVTATQMVNAALDRGGYQYPLDEPLQDAILRNTIIGLIVGEATRSSSARESWMEKMEDAAKKHLEQIEGGLTVLGAVPKDGTQVEAQIIASLRLDEPVFDVDDPDARMHDVFSDLGPGPRTWRWN